MLKDKVKTLRKLKGWTQKELAEEAKVSQQAIWKIESGKSSESRKLPQIAAALGVTAEELTGKNAPVPSLKTDLSAREWKLIQAFRNAEDSVKQAIEGAAGILPFAKETSIEIKSIRAKSSRIQTY